MQTDGEGALSGVEDQEAVLSEGGLPAPPFPEMVVTQHEISGGNYEKPIFYIVLESEPLTTYTASAQIYVPSSYQGSDISLIFHGNAFIHLRQADLRRRDQWQEISVTSVTADGQRECAPSLSIAHSEKGVVFTAGWKVTKAQQESSKPIAPVKINRRKTYSTISMQDFLLQHGELESVKCLDAVALEIAPIAFGDRQNPGFECAEYPEPGSWGAGRIEIPEIRNHTLKNAVVHGESGVVTVGDQLIIETLKLPSYEDFEISWVGENLLSMPDGDETVLVGHGAHLFCGYPGTRNYSHFLIDILSAALIPPFSTVNTNATLLASHLYQAYQREYLNYFPEFFDRALFVKAQTKIVCATLDVSTFSLINSHYVPHPYHREVLRGLGQRVMALHPVLGQRYPQKIYIDRRDSAIRRLLNENEVIRCVERYGFTPVSLTGLSVADQIALFSNATHIIAPHGAGSTNILFCDPGVKYLELFMDNYVQWSMRRMNSLVPVNYGCVVGCEIPDSESGTNSKWLISIDRLEQALRGMMDV